jgi:hypothetical protein
MNCFQVGGDDVCMVADDLLYVSHASKAADPNSRLEQPLGGPAYDVCTLKCPSGLLFFRPIATPPDQAPTVLFVRHCQSPYDGQQP